MATVLQMTFSDPFSCMKIVFSFKFHWGSINPLRAIFFRENIIIYLHFMSFVHTNRTQVVEIPPQVRRGPAYST